MGIVNDYINKIVNMINKSKTNDEKPWLQYYDRMPEHLEYYNGSMYDAVSDVANKYPLFPALEYFEKVYTYEELIKNIDNVAVGLKEINVVENECVTICMPNIPEAIFIIYAVNKIGAICNIIHPLSKEQDIKKAMEDKEKVAARTSCLNFFFTSRWRNLRRRNFRRRSCRPCRRRRCSSLRRRNNRLRRLRRRSG